MKLRYTGTYEALKAKLSPIEGDDGQWVDLNENQKQFRHSSGGIMNWFPSTGTINFQGKPDAQRALEEAVGQLLAQSPEPNTSATSGSEHPPELRAPSISAPPRLNEELRGQAFADSELVVGLVGAVGTELAKIVE